MAYVEQSAPPNGISHAVDAVAAPRARVYADALFAEHADEIERLCRGMLRDRAEAEDATQQTFLSAYRALLGGVEPRSGAAWLATIARNECLRRAAGRGRVPVPAAELDETPHPADVHNQAV